MRGLNWEAGFAGILGMIMGYAFAQHHDMPVQGLKRGDEVVISLPEHGAVYDGCKTTFIDAIALKESNVAFVLLENCDFQIKHPDGWPNPTVDIINLSYLSKAIK